MVIFDRAGPPNTSHRWQIGEEDSGGLGAPLHFPLMSFLRARELL